MPGRRTMVDAARRALKRRLIRWYLASGYPALRDAVLARAGRSRLTVLVYHQVGPSANDGSTVAADRFRDQMEYLKAHHEIVPLAEGVRRLRLPNRRRLVAVTFDDGYLDNATVAAPILQELGIPAAFFVATDMIGGRRPFPHDVRSGRGLQPHMSWDDLRRLQDAGHTVGSHTCSHVDLGTVSPADAERELAESSERIARELGERPRLFAYPYGRRRNMPEAVVRLAARYYDICCSAYGGHNIPPGDPRNVRRIVISSGVTREAFRAILEGWPILRLRNPYFDGPDARLALGWMSLLCGYPACSVS
ncbi:MAG TPA: polysaccharide deacetylase family protein [Vicinamibacterales bacterium]|nr:polysaccharide deacetylase family protein [Vicinamibacterales bacterium]